MADDDADDPPVHVRKPPPRALDVSNELLQDVDTAPGVIRTIHLSPDAAERVWAKISADQAAEAQGTGAGSDTPVRSDGRAAR